MNWETVIGLEVHVQLNTNSKLFSSSSTKFGAKPNSQASIIDLGMPGVLPVLNAEAVDKAIKLGLAIDANIHKRSIFARKNYFYPDLPKGYQISQYEDPIITGGKIAIPGEQGELKYINVTRAHLEEDAGKLIHENFSNNTAIDFNRAGMPLLEIVSEPELRNSDDVVAYLKALHELIRYIDISDGNMQEGSMRCDVNISLRPEGQKEFGTRAEIKNVNSFKFIEKAIKYEQFRQKELLESGKEVIQETRLYDSEKDETRSMRGKEEANDYRYFPDPDLLPVIITDSHMDSIKASMPELPKDKYLRFTNELKLSSYDAKVLIAEPNLAKFFDDTLTNMKVQDPKLACNWITSELLGIINKEELSINDNKISAIDFAELLNFINDDTISGKIAKSVFEKMWLEGKKATDIISELGLQQITDETQILAIIKEVIDANPKQVEQYLSGKDKLFGFFVGQVMKISKGKANPGLTTKLLKENLV